MANKIPSFEKLASKFRSIYQRAPRAVGSMAVKRMKDNFRKQGWAPGEVTMPWPKRSKEDRKKSRRAILVKTRALRRSVRILAEGYGRVSIGTDMEYAAIHNEGGTVKATQSVSEHTRRAHTRKAGNKRQTVKEHKVSSHSRRVNFKMPQRRFIGPSSEVMKEANQWIANEIDKAVKSW